MVRSPRLAVLVHRVQTPAGGAVPDALLRPDDENSKFEFWKPFMNNADISSHLIFG